MSNSLWPHRLGHARLPCPPPTPRACSNSYPLSWWYHPTIASSAIPFSSCPQSCPASGSFPMSHLFTSGDQSIGVSASASVFLMTLQGWFPLGLIGWISLQSKGLSRVFSSTTVQKWELVINPILLMLYFIVFPSNLAWACLSCLSIIERICVFNILTNASGCSLSWRNSLNFHQQLEALGLYFDFLWTVVWCYSVFLTQCHFDFLIEWFYFQMSKWHVTFSSGLANK